ncbi:MAG TPA: hypothetical protein VIR58_18245 [Acidimicrobiales bacterium]
MGFLRRKRSSELVIDLRDSATTSKPAPPTFGSPLPCPACDGRGYLDHIDPFREVQYMHCTDCGHRYEASRAELEGSNPSTV